MTRDLIAEARPPQDGSQERISCDGTIQAHDPQTPERPPLPRESVHHSIPLLRP